MINGQSLALLFRIEFDRSPARFFLPIALALSALVAWSYRFSGIYYWADAGRALSTSAIVVSPVWATAAALHGFQDQRLALTQVRTLASRDIQTQATAAVAALATYTASAQLLVVMITLGAYIYQGAWGPFHLEVFTLAVISPCLYVVLGYIIGRNMPHIVFAPIIALVAYFVPLWLSMRNSSLRLIVPSYDQLMIVWYDWQNNLILKQLALVLSLILALIAIANLLNGFNRLTTLLFTLAVAISATIGSSLYNSSPAMLNTSKFIPFQYVCQGETVEICLHPAFERGRPLIEEELEPVLKRLQAADQVSTRLEQLPRGVGGAPTIGASGIYLDDLSPAALHGLRQEFVERLLDIDTCIGVFDESVEAYTLSTAVANYLINGPTDTPLPHTSEEEAIFNSWTEEDRAIWLNRNWTKFTECQLNAADFITAT